MKTRKIIIAVIFSILILGSNQYSSVHAKKDEIEETIHEQSSSNKKKFG